MPKIIAFENYYREYDERFIKNYHAYRSELNAARTLDLLKIPFSRRIIRR